MAKQQKVAKLGIQRERGYLYYLGKKGDVWKAPMQGQGGAKTRVISAGVTRDEGFLYFIDKDGDVARTKMARR
jgi:hypothetical protein